MPFVLRYTDEGIQPVITNTEGDEVWITKITYSDIQEAQSTFELLGGPDQMIGPNRPEILFEDLRSNPDPVLMEQTGPPEEPVVPVDEVVPLPLPEVKKVK